MKKAIDIIRSEHRALAAVLSAISELADGIGTGRFEPDFDLLEAMIEYITAVPEKVHHPKEDGYLFAALRRRGLPIAAVLDDLQLEHRDGPGRTVELQQALARYRIAGAAGYPAFRELLRAYVDGQWAHMSKEEKDVMPLAVKELSAEDWAEIDAAFAANGNPWEGPSGTYRKLFTQIVNLAPAPIGVGDPGHPTPGSH